MENIKKELEQIEMLNETQLRFLCRELVIEKFVLQAKLQNSNILMQGFLDKINLLFESE